MNWTSLNSKMLKLAFLLVWIVATLCVLGSPILDPKRLVKRGDNIRVCGRMLVDALNLLCEGEYYDPNEGSRMGKRNTQVMDPYSGWIAVALSRNEAGQQQQPEQVVPGQHERFQRGVVDECCRKSCSPSTLLSYCRRIN